MKIEHIHVRAFGKLRDFDTGQSALGDLVVVLGPNEAGKSTLFHFLTTALYGFQPASRELSPHVPWGEEEASGLVQLRLSEGKAATIERKLRSQPSGLLDMDGRVRELRNRPLPWVEHVPRTVFRQVFAVTLSELAGLDDATWSRIQDRVVGSMGASDLRSARAAADLLEREAGELWRPNRRGNQQLRILRDQALDLRSRRRDALDRDRDIRAAVANLHQQRTRLKECREARQRDRNAVDRLQVLVPLRRRLDRIATLRQRAGDLELLRGLPPEPAERLSELEQTCADIEVRIAAAEADRAGPAEISARFDTEARRVLEHREQLDLFLARANAHAADRGAISEIEAELDRIAAELDLIAESRLTASWRDRSALLIREAPLERLRSLVMDLEATRRARALLQTRGPAAAVTPTNSGGSAGLAWVLVFGGLTLLFWGTSTGSAAATILGSALSAVGLVLLWPRIAGSRRQKMPEHGAAPGDEPEADPEAPLLADIGAVLDGLPVRAELRDRPDHSLVTGLERLQALMREHATRTRTLDSARSRVATIDQEGLALLVALGGDESERLHGVAAVLAARLRSAERLEAEATHADRDIFQLDSERDRLTSELAALQGERSALLKTAGLIMDDPPHEALLEAGHRLAAHAKADQLQEDVERTHPDLEHLQRQIPEAEQSPSSAIVDDEDLARRQSRIETLSDEIEELASGCQALDSQIGQLRSTETIDIVDGELETLKEEEARVIRERDRKWVLAQLLREADRRFREEHQPDLVRRASVHLQDLTGGRYDRLLIDETADGDLFQVIGPELPAPIPLRAPISTGTLEQAYLSLRLAIVDHLDQGGERLPLFIDETFVNWDRARRNRGLDLLTRLSGERQIFVFTCHPEVADRLSASGAHRLDLEPDQPSLF